MSAKMRNLMITAGLSLLLSALVVWASNNIRSVKDLIG